MAIVYFYVLLCKKISIMSCNTNLLHLKSENSVFFVKFGNVVFITFFSKHCAGAEILINMKYLYMNTMKCTKNKSLLFNLIFYMQENQNFVL